MIRGGFFDLFTPLGRGSWDFPNPLHRKAHVKGFDLPGSDHTSKRIVKFNVFGIPNTGKKEKSRNQLHHHNTCGLR